MQYLVWAPVGRGWYARLHTRGSGQGFIAFGWLWSRCLKHARIRLGRRPKEGRFGGPQISRIRPSRSESKCLLRYWRLYNDTLNAIVITNLGVFNACLYGTWRVLIPRSFKIWGIILIYLWKYWTILTHIWGNYGNYFLNSSCPIWTI